jgi:NAD-dependent deacetylase
MTHSTEEGFVELIRDSEQILVFTGAGISTLSGIPDYRGPQGVWKRHQPVYYESFMASEEARVEYWSQKLETWESFRDARPNDVHYAIVELERAGKLLMLVTQNIDGLHGRAGTSPERLVEIHGTNAAVECQSCLKRSEPGPHFARFRQDRQAPRCACGGFLKPATISFGQSLREEDLTRAFGAADGADLVISLGSTLSVQPAAMVPLQAALRGCPYVIVNRGPTDHDGQSAVTLRFEGDVGAIFPPAVRAALGA